MGAPIHRDLLQRDTVESRNGGDDLLVVGDVHLSNFRLYRFSFATGLGILSR